MPPAPTPTPILEARGSWRAKTRTGEPRPPVEAPDRPSQLKGEARKEWDRQVRLMENAGCIAKLDRALLACWCEEWADYLHLASAVRKSVQNGNYKQAIADGLLSARRNAVKVLIQLAGQLGFSPSARTRLQAIETQPESKLDTFRIA